MNIGQPNGEPQSEQQVDNIFRVKPLIKKVQPQNMSIYIENSNTGRSDFVPSSLTISLKITFSQDIGQYTNGKQYLISSFADHNSNPTVYTYRKGLGSSSYTLLGNTSYEPNYYYTSDGDGFTIHQNFPVEARNYDIADSYRIDVVLPPIGLLVPAIPEGRDSQDFVKITTATVYTSGISISHDTYQGRIMTLVEGRSVGPMHASQNGQIQIGSSNNTEPRLRFQLPGVRSIENMLSFTTYYAVNGQDHRLYTTNDFERYLQEGFELPFPVSGYSLPHDNHSGSENGIRYHSTRPSSKVSDDVKKKNFQGLLNIINKLTKRKQHENR